MNPIYENINVAINTSLKVATYSHTKSCPTTNWHVHPEYELVYVRNGRGILKIDSKTTSYEDGVLLFLGPNIPHADFGNKEFTDNLEVVVQFTQTFIDEKLIVFPEFRKLKKLIQASHGGLLFDPMVKSELSTAFEKFDTPSDIEKLLNLLLILEKLSNTDEYKTVLSKNKVTNHKTSDVNRLENVFQFVNENYKEQMSVGELAAHVGLTKNSFCRFFKKMTQKTFVQFVNEFRIGKAIDIFNENRMPVAEVMYLCGFNDPSYFTKQFKKYQGRTPSEYILQETLI